MTPEAGTRVVKESESILWYLGKGDIAEVGEVDARLL
jgi:hypothetical protein